LSGNGVQLRLKKSICALCDSKDEVVFDADINKFLCPECINDLKSGEER